jgi:DNA-binding SARP family transcriptional activator
MLELNLFGIPELRWEGKLLALPSPKNLAILSYLVMSGERVSRKDLSELFWKEGKASNVRFVLHKLREIPGSENWLETNDQFVSVKAETDVKRFERAIHNERYGEALEVHPSGEVVLKGLELNDADHFMNWLELERSHLSQLYLDALQGHITELERTDNTNEALKLARQLLGQDKLNESTHRAIMRLEHKRGNTEAALAQFEQLRQILKEELEVEPLEDTLKLLGDIEGIGASSTKNALLLTSATAIPAKPDKLFGRDKLLEDVETHLASNKRVLLHGFGGAGKTALATLIAARWLEHKAPVLWLQAGDDDANTLFDALAGVFDAQQTLSQSKDAAKTIRDLLSKNKISLFVLDDVWNAYALSKVMEAIPDNIPLLVTSRQRYPNLTRVDVGRLDRPASLELLTHYAQPPLTGEVSESQSNLVNSEDGVLATNDGLSDGGVLVRNVTSLAEHMAKENPPVLGLQGTKSTSSVDVSSPVRGGKDEGGANQLCELLGDHAFALRIAGITLAVDGLIPEMLLERIATAPHTLKTPLEFAEAGRESVAALLSASLTALSEEAYEAFMGFGVLFTTSCTSELLALCTRRSEEETEEALMNLQKRGLADRVSEAGSDVITYRLHDLAYSFARANNHFRMSTAQRACQVFLEKHQHDFNVLDAEITNLLGATETAKDWKNDELFVQMMRELAVGNAYYAARGHSPRSFELLKAASDTAKALGDLEAAHYLIARMGDTYRELYGDLDRALEAFEEALRLARAVNNTEREAILLGLVGAVRFHQGNQDAINYFEKGYQLAKSSQLNATVSRILQHLGYVACYEQDWEAARGYNLEAIDLVKDSSQAEQRRNLFFSLLNLGEAELKLGHLEEALSARQQALTVTQDQGNLLLRAYALEGIGEVHHELGNRPLAQENFQRALELFYQNHALTDMEDCIELMKKEGYSVSLKQIETLL